VSAPVVATDSRRVDIQVLRAVIVPNPLTSHNLVSDMQLASLDGGGAMPTFGELYGHDGKPIEQLMRYATTGYSLDFLLPKA
jgi:hypothetical protein